MPAAQTMAEGVFNVSSEDVITNIVPSSQYTLDDDTRVTMVQWRADHPRNTTGERPNFPGDTEGIRNALCEYFENLIGKFEFQPIRKR